MQAGGGSYTWTPQVGREATAGEQKQGRKGRGQGCRNFWEGVEEVLEGGPDPVWFGISGGNRGSDPGTQVLRDLLRPRNSTRQTRIWLSPV
jgi:hypothetical protein